MHPTPTGRLAAGIALAALALFAAPGAASAEGNGHRHPGVGASPAASPTPAPAHSHDMDDMDGMDGMDMGGTDAGTGHGMDETAPHGHAGHGGAAVAGSGLDSWAHRGVLITFAVLNATVLFAAAVLRRRRPTSPRKARPARTLPAPTGRTA